MQVFLPYPDFTRSLMTLDPDRLGNQVYREGKTLLGLTDDSPAGWVKHPAYQIWKDYKPALAQYCLIGLDILEFRNSSPPTAEELYEYFADIIFSDFAERGISAPNTVTPITELPVTLPPIIGHHPFHLSHRLNLLYKGQQDETFLQAFTNPLRYTYPKLGHPTPFPREKRGWTGAHYTYFWKTYGIPEYNYYRQHFSEPITDTKPEYVWLP
jgi:hypothetical protein